MQEMSQEKGITLLGKHIKCLHIHDNNGERDQHMYPFLGTLDMDSLVAGLKKIGYDGYFTLEAANILRPSSVSDSCFKMDLELKLESEKFLCTMGRKIIECYSL